MSDTTSDRLFRETRYEEAAARLKEGLEKEGDGNDQLLYLLDLGLAYHSAGMYQESNRYFLEADKIADIKDYTSLATEAATLLTSDNIKQYKGEDFEKVLINVYLAINFSMLGQAESALVEARRVNRKLYMMVTDGQRKYKMNAFAYFLSGVLYESSGEYNDAYIDYKKVLDLAPEFPSIGRDLWRMAWLLNMADERERWEKRFSISRQDQDETRKLAAYAGKPAKMGEIIVFFENGISPIKRPHPSWYSIPKFFPRSNPVTHARLFVNGVESGQTSVLHDIESTAIENLDEKWGGLLAKKLAGVVAKEVVGKQVENVTKSEALGVLTKLALYISDQADVRSWSLLPKDLQAVRVSVPPGKHRVRLDYVGVDGREPPEREVEVVAGKKVFLNFRYVP